jgi:V/A-type H+-transporting ATPase subunit K
MKKRILFFVPALLLLGGALFAQTAGANGAAAAAGSNAIGNGIKYLGAALAVGIACLGGGIAVGQIGAGAMGAMSENPEISGKAMPYVGLAEGICLWGFLVALLILVI